MWMLTAKFIRWNLALRSAGRSNQFRQQREKPKGLPPEANPWFWNPSKAVGSCLPPSYIQRNLEEIDPNLTATWDNYQKRWNVYIRSNRINNRICSGWLLLFAEPQIGPWTYARLYEADKKRWGNGREYWNAIQRETERKAESAHRATQQDTMDRAMVSWDHSRISVSGYGPSNGSKFSTYHS